MLSFSYSFRTAFLIFVILLLLTVLNRPSFFYTEEGQLKKFGTESKETLLPLPLVLTGVMVLIYGILLIMEHRKT